MKPLEREASERIGEALKGFGTHRSTIPLPGPMTDIPEDCVYEVSCDCGWVGMREECFFHGRCPNCGDKARRLYE
jgi:hypothetical protein